jgi:hypothetical protein
MKKVIYKSALNADEFPYDGEVNNEPSLTVPDQSMSIQTILERYARGLPIGGRTDEYYDEDDTMPDYRSLDLTEIAELQKNVKDTIENYKNNVSTFVDNSVDNSEGVIKTDEAES